SVPFLLVGRRRHPSGETACLTRHRVLRGAALIAETIWFEAGKRRGRGILRLLCRVSLEPDYCVRQTENAFVNYGMSSLLGSKNSFRRERCRGRWRAIPGPIRPIPFVRCNTVERRLFPFGRHFQHAVGTCSGTPRQWGRGRSAGVLVPRQPLYRI